MKSNWLLKSVGIISASDLQNVISLVKKKYGTLAASESWNHSIISSSARNLLKKSDIEQSVASLMEQINLRPYTYINGWSKSQAFSLFKVLKTLYEKEMK